MVSIVWKGNFQMRRKLGVLAAQIDETSQTRFLNAFIKEAYEKDYDVCIFSMHQKYQETDLRNQGDSNIFELVNYELFDGIIILLDTLLTPGLAERLQRQVMESFTGPVLVVDQESSYFPSVMMDHYSPFKKLMDHLLEAHGYQEIGFLGGKEGHVHSVQRYEAFLDSMKEHQVPLHPEWISHGNYWYDSAEEYAWKLLGHREHLPRAIACANDIMAIGVASILSENGIRIPEDVAIIGYDSIEDGRFSPSPLTSAEIPADETGAYCFHWIYALLMEQPVPKYHSKTPLIIGGSCGCNCEIALVPDRIRAKWRTHQSSRGLFSDFNHIIEDLLSENTMQGFLQMITEYEYQIRPFTEFALCLNEDYTNPEKNSGEKARRFGYSNQMVRVLYSGEDGEHNLQPVLFPKKELLPTIAQERDYPTTYIFTPFYFDDRCFGYSVLNYGREIRLYDKYFRVWMRNIMQGMESFYRQQYMQLLVNKIKADQVRDSLTGLYNYQGFLREGSRFCRGEKSRAFTILALDLQGIKRINEIQGRESGDRTLRIFSRAILEGMNEVEISARMCNDEFLVLVSAENAEKCEQRAESLLQIIQENMNRFAWSDAGLGDYMPGIHVGEFSFSSAEEITLEEAINHATSMKNYRKKSVSKKCTENYTIMEEIKRGQLVERILNENLLTYYFQPIVNARDGSIYAYEALMRYEEAKISPVQILEAAAYLNRLQDVERATIFNVTGYVRDHLEQFGDSKVFINCLPGYQMKGEESLRLKAQMQDFPGRYVIEITEGSEIDDDGFRIFRGGIDEFHNGIALDDYGAGFSNINNLLRYMPDYVKIDRMLIQDIQDNPQKQHFVRNIIEFAHDNQIQALAEGVETQEELKACIYLGIDLIQGYYTGKATKIPIRRLPESLRSEIRYYNRELKQWNSML